MYTQRRRGGRDSCGLVAAAILEEEEEEAVRKLEGPDLNEPISAQNYSISPL